MNYASIKLDSWNKHLHRSMRQVSAISVEEIDISRKVSRGIEFYSWTKKRTIAREFTKNLLDDFESRENGSNLDICKKMVKANRKGKLESIHNRVNLTFEYCLSLEKFNICRNCKFAIKIKSAFIREQEERLQRNKTRNLPFAVNTLAKREEVKFAITEACYRVRINSLGKYEYYFQDRQVVYNFCNCPAKKQRSIELKAKREAAKLEAAKKFNWLQSQSKNEVEAKKETLRNVKVSKIRIIKKHLL